MKAFIGRRGNGKTIRLLKYAKKTNSLVLTTNSRAMREKAKAVGCENVEIIGFGDLKNDNFSFAKDVLVDNAENVLAILLDKYYGLNLGGYTITIDEKEKQCDGTQSAKT